jgi:hypothetical protein
MGYKLNPSRYGSIAIKGAVFDDSAVIFRNLHFGADGTFLMFM